MTKELLEQYPHICAELRDMDVQVTDTVSASASEPPYVQHTVSIQGVPSSERRLKKEHQKAEIEAFVEGIEDAELRRIVTYRALQKMPWAQVAAKMGWGYTEAGVKMKYHRFFGEI